MVYNIGSPDAREVSKGSRVYFARRVDPVYMPLQSLHGGEVFTADTFVLLCVVLGIIRGPCRRISGGPAVV